MEQRTREEEFARLSANMREGNDLLDRPSAQITTKWLWVVPVAVASAVFLGTMIAPPHLMDDVDGVQAQIARTMLSSGDWITPRLNGIVDFEKPPFLYWMIAASYALFGVSDWAARLPVATSAVALCFLVYQIGAWAFGRKAGVMAGVCLSTSVGLFLFSRVLFHDIPLTLSISIAMWAALRALDSEEESPRAWAYICWTSVAVAILIKGLVGFVLPVTALLLYLALTRTVRHRETWQKLRPGFGLVILLLLAGPWHLIAIWQHPPHFDISLDTEPVRYRGFFWFYFVNEHVLRFLNLRYPRDYTSIPVIQFLLFHFIWLFPWSVYLPCLRRLNYRGCDRASRVHLFAVCWAASVLLFFCISTRLEYYTLPAYPAIALLLGSAIASSSVGSLRRYARITGSVAAICFIVIAAILVAIRDVDTPGDLSSALQRNPALYTMALGHMQDLTIEAFAYLRPPLMIAALACLVGTTSVLVPRVTTATIAIVAMMVIFFHAARTALVTFDPHMGSFPLAKSLLQSPPGHLIVDDQYFTFSSVLFYSNRQAKLLNGRVMNLEYGSYAPGAPTVFIDDSEFRRLWLANERQYLVSSEEANGRFESLVGRDRLHAVTVRGGKVLFTNFPIDETTVKTPNANSRTQPGPAIAFQR